MLTPTTIKLMQDAARSMYRSARKQMDLANSANTSSTREFHLASAWEYQHAAKAMAKRVRRAMGLDD